MQVQTGMRAILQKLLRRLVYGQLARPRKHLHQALIDQQVDSVLLRNNNLKKQIRIHPHHHHPLPQLGTSACFLMSC